MTKKSIYYIAMLISMKLVLLVSKTYAQQVPVYSLQHLIKTQVNPAYSGHEEVSDFILLNRQQWVGFKGAPKSFFLAANVPLENRNTGVGFNIQQQASGPFTQNSFFLNYSFKFDVSEFSSISLGLSGGINNYRIMLNDLNITNSGDYLFENNAEDLYLPNFGIGTHFAHKNYYIDFSIPVILRNELDKRELKNDRNNLEDRFYHLNTGFNYIFSDELTFQPSLILWLADGVPPLIDLRISAKFKAILGVGLTYRIAGLVGGFFSYNLTENMIFAYSYELPLAYNYQVSSGTHELLLGIDFQLLKRKTLSPRRF